VHACVCVCVCVSVNVRVRVCMSVAKHAYTIFYTVNKFRLVQYKPEDLLHPINVQPHDVIAAGVSINQRCLQRS